MMQQIIKNEEKLQIAMTTSDVKIMDELIHEDLLFNIPSGQTITKAMDLESYRSGAMKTENMIDNTVITTVTMELKGNYMDQLIDQKLRFLRVWKHFDNQWKIIAGSSIVI